MDYRTQSQEEQRVQLQMRLGEHRKFVTHIKSYEQGYNDNLFGGWIWQYGRHQEQWVWDRSGKKIALENTSTGERHVGLQAINRILREKLLIVEAF